MISELWEIKQTDMLRQETNNWTCGAHKIPGSDSRIWDAQSVLWVNARCRDPDVQTLSDNDWDKCDSLKLAQEENPDHNTYA